MKLSLTIFTAALLLIAQACFAQMNMTSIDQKTVSQRPAIRNTYAGGQDEDDLRVQAQLYEPTTILDRQTLNEKVINAMAPRRQPRNQKRRE